MTYEKLDHPQSCDICLMTIVRGSMKRITVNNLPVYVCDSCCFDLERGAEVEVDATKTEAHT